MAAAADQMIHNLLATLAIALVVGYALWLLVRGLSRSRPDLSIGGPVAVAVLVRVAAAGGVSLTGIAGTLRGGDESSFLGDAIVISQTPFGSSSWMDALIGDLHVFGFAAQIWALAPPETALRITQAGIAVAGLALLAVAVYELAGPRAATIAMWLLAFEPASVFFSSLLHKEPNMMLAGGLVAFGGAVMWKSGKLSYLLPISAGCLVAITTRPYAGWFLIAAGAAITLHVGLRAHRQASVRGLALLAIVFLFGAISAPTALELSSDESLERNLQPSQEANTREDDDANLSLERVDFSTREAVIINLPQRMFDVLLRPYPWWAANTEQQLGVLGSLAALTVLALLLRELIRNRGRIMERAGPLVYVGFFLLIAYSLSAGNAGTAFRYRTHLVAPAICIVTALWIAREQRTRSAAKERAAPAWLASGSAPEQA
jgi:hypothetical protein